MTKNIIHFTVLFIVMVLLQIICSKILLFDLATPLVYIYFIIRLPINLSKNWLYTLSFLLGLVVDIFNNTHGMNALACTLMSATRGHVFNAYMGRDDDMSNPIPSIASLGTGVYLKYMINGAHLLHPHLHDSVVHLQQCGSYCAQSTVQCSVDYSGFVWYRQFIEHPS